MASIEVDPVVLAAAVEELVEARCHYHGLFGTSAADSAQARHLRDVAHDRVTVAEQAVAVLVAPLQPGRLEGRLRAAALRGSSAAHDALDVLEAELVAARFETTP